MGSWTVCAQHTRAAQSFWVLITGSRMRIYRTGPGTLICHVNHGNTPSPLCHLHRICPSEGRASTSVHCLGAAELLMMRLLCIFRRLPCKDGGPKVLDGRRSQAHGRRLKGCLPCTDAGLLQSPLSIARLCNKPGGANECVPQIRHKDIVGGASMLLGAGRSENHRMTPDSVLGACWHGQHGVVQAPWGAVQRCSGWAKLLQQSASHVMASECRQCHATARMQLTGFMFTRVSSSSQQLVSSLICCCTLQHIACLQLHATRTWCPSSTASVSMPAFCKKHH